MTRFCILLLNNAKQFKSQQNQSPKIGNLSDVMIILMHQSNQNLFDPHKPSQNTSNEKKKKRAEKENSIYSYLYERFEPVLMPMMENKQHQSSNQKKPKKPNDPTRQSPPHWAPEFDLPPPHFCRFLPKLTGKSETQKNPHLKQGREIKYKRSPLHLSSLAICRILCFKENDKLLLRIENRFQKGIPGEF